MPQAPGGARHRHDSLAGRDAGFDEHRGGTLRRQRRNGSANFDFRVPHEGADYQFTAEVTNINLHALAADLASSTNHLEGALSGWIAVTRGDTRDWRTIDGYGQARLRDGLIWDIPLFGILSPVLNSFSPGLGNSRATDAQAKFVITNGVIYSDPLEINTGMTRLEYSGTVDLRGNVNAHVTAQLLHNLRGIGPLISTFFYPVTKLFEYKVTGTLDNPKKESVFLLPKTSANAAASHPHPRGIDSRRRR